MNIPLGLRACARPMEDRAVTADVPTAAVCTHPALPTVQRQLFAFAISNTRHVVVACAISRSFECPPVAREKSLNFFAFEQTNG